MTAKELNYKLQDLGYKAFLSFCGVKPDEKGDFSVKEHDKVVYAYENPTECYNRIDKVLVNEIRKTYNLLLKKAIDENFFFIGANYKTLVNSVMKDMSRYNNPTNGYEEEDFIKVKIEDMKFSLKYCVIDYSQLKETPEFEAGMDSHFLFLNMMQLSGIRRNLEKTIEILEELLRKRNDIWVKNRIEELLRYKKPTTTSNAKKLKDLFVTDEKYNLFINKMKEKNLLKEEDGIFSLVIPEEFEKTGRKTYICSVGLKLNNKDYFKVSCQDVDIIRAFNLFFNTTLKKQNYDSTKSSTRLDEYFKYTTFL